jgi:hypothetical protein
MSIVMRSSNEENLGSSIEITIENKWHEHEWRPHQVLSDEQIWHC